MKKLLLPTNIVNCILFYGQMEKNDTIKVTSFSIVKLLVKNFVANKW